MCLVEDYRWEVHIPTLMSESARDTYSMTCEFQGMRRERARIRHTCGDHRPISPRWTLCADSAFQRLSGHCWGDQRRAIMLPRSVRVGTIHTSAVEVRDRSRTAYRAFYARGCGGDFQHHLRAFSH